MMTLGVVAVLATLLTFVWASSNSISVEADHGNGGIQTKEISDALRNPDNPQSLLVEARTGPSLNVQSIAPQFAAGEYEIGDLEAWVALSDTGGFYYVKVFELRAANAEGEVWVAVGDGLDPNGDPDGVFGLDFPDGDCRNDGVRNVVTDAQAEYLLDEFTNNIKPTDQAWFDEPNFRDGAAGLLPRPSLSGKQVVLVDNVRDDNFYDTDNANTMPYIAGFFTSAMDFFHARNVMTVDGYDWLHRTGADPAHAPSADPCLNAPARPYLYEGVFAHEYQHLIHNDYDADETNWVNEGMSDLAILLTGYGDPSLHVDEKGHDGHITNYQGWASVGHPDWNPIPRPSGPENSLTNWGDQGASEILEDYGFAYTFMVYLLDHGYGQDFFMAWHHNTLNGIESLNDTFSDMGSDDTFNEVFDNVIVMTLVDGYLDEGADLVVLDGGNSCFFSCSQQKAALQSDSMNSTIYPSAEAYGTPGAPPWGADYIPLGRGATLNKLKFDGDDLFTYPGGNNWTIDGDGYWSSPDVAGDTTYPNGLDSSIAREVSVPAAPATLTFEHWYQIELAWDFGFVQVLDGAQFVSLPCTGTTSAHNPGANPSIAANVPGYTGPTDDPGDPSTAGTPGAPLAVSCDLSAYAGQDIVLAFRLMTDSAVTMDGWHIRDAEINGTPVDPTPDDLSDWDNEQFFQPVDLGFELTLVGIDGKVDDYGHVTKADQVTVVRTDLNAGSTYSINFFHRLLLLKSDEVFALVTGVPDDESSGLYFPYSLKLKNKEYADGASVH
jgi:hypothetical protein